MSKAAKRKQKVVCVETWNAQRIHLASQARQIVEPMTFDERSGLRDKVFAEWGWAPLLWREAKMDNIDSIPGYMLIEMVRVMGVRKEVMK